MKKEKRDRDDSSSVSAIIFALLTLSYFWVNYKDPVWSLSATLFFVLTLIAVYFWGYDLGKNNGLNETKGRPGREEDLWVNEVYEDLGHVEISGKIIAFLRSRDDSLHAYVVHEAPPKVFRVKIENGVVSFSPLA